MNGGDGEAAGEGTRAPDRRTRRWSAFLLSLLAPGLGQLALGYPRRMVAWFSGLVVALGCTVIGAFSSAASLALVAGVLAVGLRLASAFDSLRLARPAELPRARNVALIAVGLFAFWEIIGLQIRSGLIEAFQMPSTSMYPTLEVGDHIFASKVRRRYGRGEVIVFKYPKDPSVSYVKRIVAVGGDTVELRGDTLFVNGQPAPRTETSRPCLTEPDRSCHLWEEELDGHRYTVAEQGDARGAFEDGPTTVPAGSVFVLGDNRDNSSDSRAWGPVPMDLVVGRVTGLWWSRGPEGIRWDRINMPIR